MFGSILNIYHSTPILCCTTGVWGGGAGVQAHHQKFWFGENPWKSGQNLWKLSQNPWNSEQTLKIWAKMAHNGSQKNMKNFFFGGRSFFLGKFGRILANIFRIPKNVPATCCTTTDLGIFC